MASTLPLTSHNSFDWRRDLKKNKSSATRKWASKISEEMQQAAGAVIADLETSSLKQSVDRAMQTAKQALDSSGATAAKVYEVTQDHLDGVTGAKILRLVEERLEIQARYNDILATKLNEALRRLEAIEQRLQGSA
jgi:Asp-tRNA(Asn)/Glu-tRNA(Gln) amidotransferase A subunit family amidase